MNKCPKCGYAYGENDVYCAMCGNKLVIDEFDEKSSEIERGASFLNSFKSSELAKKYANFEFFSSSKKNTFSLDNIVFNFIGCMLITCLVLCGILYFSVEKQNHKRMQLQYVNLLKNPQQIPELKQPENYTQLALNLQETEKFLNLYLKFSQDEVVKREQIFTSYLQELDKLSNFTQDVLLDGTIKECTDMTGVNAKNICANKLNKLYSQTSISVYSNGETLYLYPDYYKINQKYKKYFSGDIRKYLQLRAKYNAPTSIGLDLFISPKLLADKIFDYEQFFKTVQNLFVKEELEALLYDDFRKFIFTPSIYATTTQEMKREFRVAFRYFLKTKKTSGFYPVVMSYMDKKRSYSDLNLKNDYPYRFFENSFASNVNNSTMNDIFAQLRKNIFSQNAKYVFAYVYNIQKGGWIKYQQNAQILQNEYVMSEVDDNNNVAIYSNTFSLVQDLNIPKYGKLYLIGSELFIYNSDNLSLSKIIFNGRNFTLRKYSSSDVTSLFPGIEVINIDTYSNYNIRLTKDNNSAQYIVLSRYSQGYNQYTLSSLKGEIKKLVLPNMFSVSGTEEVIVSFHSVNLNPEITSDNSPTYKFRIRTRKSINESIYDEAGFIKYDEKTAKEEENSTYQPTFMPKIIQENEEKHNNAEVKEDNILAPPSQQITPPKDSEKDLDDEKGDKGSIKIEFIDE